jgi:hypothetical protein
MVGMTTTTGRYWWNKQTDGIGRIFAKDGIANYGYMP